MLGYLSLDIICSSKLKVRFSEQIMTSADKYPSIFSRQMETIVYVFSVINQRYFIPHTTSNKALKFSTVLVQPNTAKDERSRSNLYSRNAHMNK